MKKYFAMLGAIALATAAQADLLKWQVVDSNAYPSWNYARVGYYTTGSGSPDNATFLGLTADADTSSPADQAPAAAATGVTTGDGIYAILPSPDSSAYTYYIELGNYDSSTSTFTAVARSEEKSYSQLANNYIITDAQLNALNAQALQAVAAWNGGTFTAVPEPTGAMLMLLGFATLSLRRRRV